MLLKKLAQFSYVCRMFALCLILLFFVRCGGGATECATDTNCSIDDICHQKRCISRQCNHPSVLFCKLLPEQGTSPCDAARLCQTDGRWGACLPISPKKEECNGKDDDCDGVIDNIKPEDSPLCHNQHGVCANTRKSCIQGQWIECGVTDYKRQAPSYEEIETSCDDGVNNACKPGGGDCKNTDCAKQDNRCRCTDKGSSYAIGHKLPCQGYCAGDREKKTGETICQEDLKWTACRLACVSCLGDLKPGQKRVCSKQCPDSRSVGGYEICQNDGAFSECQAICDPPCPNGSQRCGEQCVDPLSHSQHCGACFFACSTAQSCKQGTCVCLSGQLCGNACVDTLSHANHCGQCGNACGNSQICIKGVCGCRAGFTVCNKTCVNTNTDENHCGACDSKCGTGEVCRNGNCVCNNVLYLINIDRACSSNNSGGYSICLKAAQLYPGLLAWQFCSNRPFEDDLSVIFRDANYPFRPALVKKRVPVKGLHCSPDFRGPNELIDMSYLGLGKNSEARLEVKLIMPYSCTDQSNPTAPALCGSELFSGFISIIKTCQ